MPPMMSGRRDRRRDRRAGRRPGAGSGTAPARRRRRTAARRRARRPGRRARARPRARTTSQPSRRSATCHRADREHGLGRVHARAERGVVGRDELGLEHERARADRDVLLEPVVHRHELVVDVQVDVALVRPDASWSSRGRSSRRSSAQHDVGRGAGHGRRRRRLHDLDRGRRRRPRPERWRTHRRMGRHRLAGVHAAASVASATTATSAGAATGDGRAGRRSWFDLDGDMEMDLARAAGQRRRWRRRSSGPAVGSIDATKWPGSSSRGVRSSPSPTGRERGDRRPARRAARAPPDRRT